MDKQSPKFHYRGGLVGHRGWVTSIATTPNNPDIIVSGSRDKSIIVWQITHQESGYGHAHRALKGHNGFVSDVAFSADGQHVISASWDKTMRLWNLQTGTTTKRFVGHGKDVLSLSFSPDNTVVASGARDKSIKLWNMIGECVRELTEGGHGDWVSCVRISPNPMRPLLVSCGWDKLVKVWDLPNGTLRTNHHGHTGFVSTTTISPDGSLCASGGKDGVAMLWDLNEGKHLYSLDAGCAIHSLTFSPSRYWLCAATDEGIKIWDLESKKLVSTLSPDFADEVQQGLCEKSVQQPACVSIAWSQDETLFAGYTDNLIRVWQVVAA